MSDHTAPASEPDPQIARLLARLQPHITHHREHIPTTPIDPDAPLARGDIRQLRPHPHYPNAEPLLVLINTTPTEYDMPDDITDHPGPCHILHVTVLDTPHEWATVRDLPLPTTLTGTPYPLTLITDLFTTIRLDHDDPNGLTRFGPKLGNTLPSEIASLGWTAFTLNTHQLAEHVHQLGLSTGQLEPQSGDHLWAHQIRLCRQLNTLTHW